MDPEELNNNGVGNASTPLLVSEMEESSHGDALSIRGGGEEEEQQKMQASVLSERTEFSHDDSDESSSHRANRCSGQCHKIPTLVFILVPMIIFLIGVFLASAFMPHTTHDNEKKYSPTSPPSPQQQLVKKHNALHDDPISPTLLSIRDHINGALMNVHTNYLYKRLKTATYHHKREPSRNTLLQSDKNEVGHGEPLTIKWSSSNTKDEDIIALYCPAFETNPTKFRDAATLAHVKATHNFSQGQNSEWLSSVENNVWTIPSFPIVREETCEFRMYTHSNSVDDGTEEGEDDAEHHHYYTLVGATDPIFLTSNQDPKGVHIGLTGKVSEMFIQFNTGDSGESIVEYVKKSDINVGNNLYATQRAMTAGGNLELVSEINWTKVKGTSTSYSATDMCQEPATSTEP